MPVDSANVYTGLWINWSRGRALGATITVPTSTGTILTAIVAIFIQFVGTHLWHLIRYAVHQFRATDLAVHPLQRQIQATLRNNGSPFSTSLQLLRELWAWRGMSAPLASALSFSAFGFVLAATFTASSIFSTRIIDSGVVDVLLTSPYCGYFNPDIRNVSNDLDLLSQHVFSGSQSFLIEGMRDGTRYAQDCYNGTSTLRCGEFAVPTFKWSTDYFAPCPFASEMCVGPAMKQDTGRMNSNDVLGFNFPENDQISLRKVTTCAPMRQDGFVQRSEIAAAYTMRSTNQSIKGTLYKYHYQYGQATSESPGVGPTTLVADTLKANGTTYKLAAFRYSPNYNDPIGNSFTPISQLNRSDGMVATLFVSLGSTVVTSPIDDPIFAAHHAVNLTGAYNRTAYAPDNFFGVLGCVEQYEICNPASPTGGESCTALSDGMGMLKDTDSLGLNDIQTSTAIVIGDMIVRMGTDVTQWGAQDPSSLVASRSISDMIQYPLPPNQWQVEMENLQATVMSTLQSRLRLRVIGPSDSSARMYIKPPGTDAERRVCMAQRIRTGQGFSNVSLLGLLIVLCLGILIILASLLLESVDVCLGSISKATKRRHHKSWIHDHVLQIQRVAYEGQSRDKWHKIDGEVPVTASCDVMLGPLEQDRPFALNADTSTDMTRSNGDDKSIRSESPVAERSRTDNFHAPLAACHDEGFPVMLMPGGTDGHEASVGLPPREVRNGSHEATLSSDGCGILNVGHGDD